MNSHLFEEYCWKKIKKIKLGITKKITLHHEFRIMCKNFGEYKILEEILQNGNFHWIFEYLENFAFKKEQRNNETDSFSMSDFEISVQLKISLKNYQQNELNQLVLIFNYRFTSTEMKNRSPTISILCSYNMNISKFLNVILKYNKGK